MKEEVPTDWKTNITAPKHKIRATNYSVTTAEEYHYYVQDTKYLLHLIIDLKYTDHIIGEYQAGFKSGKPTTDQVFTVKNLLKKAWGYNRNT